MFEQFETDSSFQENAIFFQSSQSIQIAQPPG